MSQSHFPTPAGPAGGGGGGTAGTKSRKRQRTPPHPLITTSASQSSQGHHLTLMPPALVTPPTVPSHHSFSLPDPSLLSPTAAYPPVTDPLSSSLPAMLSDSLRLASPAAAAGGGGSPQSTPLSASPLASQDDMIRPAQNPFAQQQQQHYGQPSTSAPSSARPRFVARRHSDVMPISCQLSTSWTPNDGTSALLEAPAHAAGDGPTASPTSPTDSHFSQATTMQYSPTSSTFDSIAYQAASGSQPQDSQAEQPHPHVSPPSSYSPHPHVLPTIPAIGGSAFHPHSIAPPPPPPHFPPTAAYHNSPNPTAKKKMRSEAPPALLPVPSSTAAAGTTTPPSSAELGLFQPISLAVADSGANVQMFDNMIGMSQPAVSGAFDATGSASSNLQYAHQHTYLFANDAQPMPQAMPDMFPPHTHAHTHAHTHTHSPPTLNGGGAHPFMFHTPTAGNGTAPGSLIPDPHFLDPLMAAGAEAAHPSPFRPGGLLDPTTNTGSGSTFLFDVSLMNPSPMASPYMVRGSRPGSASTSSDSRPTSAHSGLVIHASTATPPQPLPQVQVHGAGTAEMARRAVAGGAYHREPQVGGALDAYELARALGGPNQVPGGVAAGRSAGGHQAGNGMRAMVVDAQHHQQASPSPSTSTSAPQSLAAAISYGGGSGGNNNDGGGGGGGGSLSPMSVPSSAAGASTVHDLSASGSQQHASASPADASSLFFTDTSSPVAIGGAAVAPSSASGAVHHHFASSGFGAAADHLDPLISAAHGDDVNGFEQLVQALLMNHPDLLPSAELAGGPPAQSFSMTTVVNAGHAPPQQATGFGSAGVGNASGSFNAVHESAEMDVDKPEQRLEVAGGQEPDRGVKLESGVGRPRTEMSWPAQDMMDVIMEDCEHPQQQGHDWNDADDDASALSDMPQAGADARRDRRSQQPPERESLPPPPIPTRSHHLDRSNARQQQGQSGQPRQLDHAGHDAHTAAAAFMLVELHNRAAPENRRMSTIDVPPPSPPSIVRVQVANSSPLASPSSSSVLPLNLPGPALYTQHHQQQQLQLQYAQQAHPQRQHPPSIQYPDTHTPTTRTLTDRQLQTIVESMLYATSLQGSCHSQGCWHMYARAYLSTHGELPGDATREPAKWVGRWGLCKVSLYTPRVAQKSYGSEKRFLCPPPMISVVGAPLFPESPLGQPMGLPPAPAVDKVPRWITLLPEADQPQVIMLMRGEIEGAELPEDPSMEAGGGAGPGPGAAGGSGEVANDTVVSTQRGERVMLSEAGWRAAASSLPAAVLSKMISALDSVKEKQASVAKRQKQQAKARTAAAAVKVESSDVEMVDDEQPEEDTGNDQDHEPQTGDEEDDNEPVTAPSTRCTRTLRPTVRSSVRTRSQLRSPSARGAAGSTPSPRKAAAAAAPPMARARRASIAAIVRDSASSTSAGESDSDSSERDDTCEDSDAGASHASSSKNKVHGAKAPAANNNKGMVAVEKYCTEALCAEVPAERWVFRNVWISDSERRKEFSCVFQLSEPAISPSAATSSTEAGADKGKNKAKDRQAPKKLLEFASKPVRVISKPSKKKIEVRSSGASPSAGIIYAGSLIALFNRIRSQTVSTKYLSIGSSVPVPSDALTREVLTCAEVNKPQKSQGDMDLDQDRFLANVDVVKHVFPGAIKSEQLKYLCSTASWAAFRLEVVDEFERDSPYLNLPQFNCQCEVCATAAEYREALLSTSPGASGASTPELSSSGAGAVSSGVQSSSARSPTVRMPSATQCLTRGKIVSFNQTVVLVDPVTGLRSREFVLRRVDNNSTVILAEGHLLTAVGANATGSAAVSAQSQVTSFGRPTSSPLSSSSASPSTRNSARQHLGSGQFPPLRPLHTHPWVLHTYRQASPCASHDPHAAAAASHALSIIQVSGSRTGIPDAQTLSRAFEAPKLDPIAQLHKVAFQLKDSAEHSGAFLTVVGNDIGVYIPQSNHMSFIQSEELKRPAASARARRNSCPAQPNQLSEAGSTKDIRAGTLTVDVTEGSVWTIVNADKADRSFYIPHPQLLEVDEPVGVDVSHQGFGLGAPSATNNTHVDNEKILSASTPARKCISSLSALSPFPTIKSHTIATAARSYMSDGTPNPASVHGMSTTLVLDGNHFLDHPFSIYLADMKCNVDWESNTHATVTFPPPVTILRHLFVGPGSARPGSVPRDASLSPKYSAFIVTPDALHAKIIEERVDTMSSGADVQLMSASQHPGGVVKAPIPVRLLSKRIIGLSLGSCPHVPSLPAPALAMSAIVSAPTPAEPQSTDSSQPAAVVADAASTVSKTNSTHSSAYNRPSDPEAPTSSADSPLRLQPPRSTISTDTHQYLPSPLRSAEPTAHIPPPPHPAVSPASVLAIPPPAGTTYPLALTTVAAPSSIFGAAHHTFPPHIHHMIQRGMLNGIPSAFPNMSAVSFNPLDARFVASAPPAALVDAITSSRYLRASMPISPEVKSNTQPRPIILTSPLAYAPINHSALTAPSPTAPPSTKSPAPPGTPSRAHSLSGKTSASQRTPTQPKAGRSSPDSSSLSSASSTPPLTKPLARSATLPPSGLKSSASGPVAPAASASSVSASGSRRGQGGQNTSKKQAAAAPEPPAVVPLPIGVVTVEMVKSPSLLLPLYFVRADGVVYETGRSFLFRLDETVLGSGNVVVLE